MWRQEYRFELPDDLIARRPPSVRGESRLMHVPVGSSDGDAPPTITLFAEVIGQFRGDEVLVLNDTRVVPARVRGQKRTGGAVEVFVVEPLPELSKPGEPLQVEALLRGKKLWPGSVLRLPGCDAVVMGPHGEGTFRVTLHGLNGLADLWTWLDAVGEVPLPPYLERLPDADDRDRYQTVFAREPGAVAAPTAGLHLTDTLLDALRAKGVSVATLTLHVGLGTFLPVRVDDLDTHVMHSERFTVPAATRALLEAGRPVVAVGTTVVRALESFARDPSATATRIFIRPGFDFRIVDGLITNFHLPESTLLMLVSAFAGRERMLCAYRAAVEARLRFFSYGDAMLLRRPGGRWT